MMFGLGWPLRSWLPTIWAGDNPLLLIWFFNSDWRNTALFRRENTLIKDAIVGLGRVEGGWETTAHASHVWILTAGNRIVVGCCWHLGLGIRSTLKFGWSKECLGAGGFHLWMGVGFLAILCPWLLGCCSQSLKGTDWDHNNHHYDVVISHCATVWVKEKSIFVSLQEISNMDAWMALLTLLYCSCEHPGSHK